MRQFHRLVRLVAERGGEAAADERPGRPWALPLADRVLLVAVYWRTNLTLRQVGPLFGISHTAAHRVVDTLGPLLALQPIRRTQSIRGAPAPCWRGSLLVSAGIDGLVEGLVDLYDGACADGDADE